MLRGLLATLEVLLTGFGWLHGALKRQLCAADTRSMFPACNAFAALRPVPDRDHGSSYEYDDTTCIVTGKLLTT
jgi:hypothetical protein